MWKKLIQLITFSFGFLILFCVLFYIFYRNCQNTKTFSKIFSINKLVQANWNFFKLLLVKKIQVLIYWLKIWHVHFKKKINRWLVLKKIMYTAKFLRGRSFFFDELFRKILSFQSWRLLFMSIVGPENGPEFQCKMPP